MGAAVSELTRAVAGESHRIRDDVQERPLVDGLEKMRSVRLKPAIEVMDI